MSPGKILTMVAALLLVAAAPAPRTLRLGTTTSAQSSGILDRLLPPFEKKYGVKVQVIAEGTGKALKTAADGNVDLVLVHAAKLEEKFVADGYGVNRTLIMRNDFVLVGPPSDPAGLKSAKDLEGALRLLKDHQALFIARADNSGTDEKERELWSLVGGPPPAGQRLEIGQGMEPALRMAHEKRAYTLSDRGTFLALKKSLDLVIVYAGDPRLDNPYSAIAVNPMRSPEANFKDAMLLIGWMAGPEGQRIIADYTIDGEALFIPAAPPAR
jgi:tungstate transport system substrate-binding protein